MTNHPITPPPELVQQWDEEGTNMLRPAYQTHLCAQAARWGADQELEACCEYMQHEDFHIRGFATELRAARRPKTQSLKARLTKAIQDKDLDTALRLVEGLDDSL